jgi:AGZA family xanthine/uracil permease-like MFS transporter
MLWGGFLAELIDRRLNRSAVYLFLLMALSFFGVIHSASPDGAMYLPWELSGLARAIPYQLASAYGALALLLLLLARTRESRMPSEGTGH